MFKTFMGPVEEDASVVYLRPETAQGSYVNFKNVQQSTRKKLPFGIAQIGKSFRNEISPGNFVFRMREFEQMEMQYFVRPDAEAAAAFEEWLPRRCAWYERYGVTPERLRLREHAPDELAHYAKKAVDVEYRFPFGWKELEGIHNRGDFDLSRHSAASGENLEYFDPATNEHFIPWIVETAAGADRAAFTFLIDAYREEEVRGETRVSLALHPELAPYKVAVLPLLKKRPEIVELCHRIKADLQARHDGRLRRHRRDRQALPAPGRDRHAVVRDGRRRLARGRRGHRPRPRLDDPGAGPGRGRQAAHPRPAGGRAGGLGRVTVGASSAGPYADQPSRSPWVAQLAPDGPPRPLDSDATTDVAIIGAGIAGVAAAFYTLGRTDRRVMLVERDRVGRGATGHNAGQLLRTVACRRLAACPGRPGARARLGLLFELGQRLPAGLPAQGDPSAIPRAEHRCGQAVGDDRQEDGPGDGAGKRCRMPPLPR